MKKVLGYRFILFYCSKQAYLNVLFKSAMPLLIFVISFLLNSCNHKTKVLPNQAMIDLLKQADEKYKSPDNVFCPEAVVKVCDSVLENTSDQNMQMQALSKKANA